MKRFVVTEELFELYLNIQQLEGSLFSAILHFNVT